MKCTEEIMKSIVMSSFNLLWDIISEYPQYVEECEEEEETPMSEVEFIEQMVQALQGDVPEQARYIREQIGEE